MEILITSPIGVRDNLLYNRKLPIQTPELYNPAKLVVSQINNYWAKTLPHLSNGEYHLMSLQGELICSTSDPSLIFDHMCMNIFILYFKLWVRIGADHVCLYHWHMCFSVIMCISLDIILHQWNCNCPWWWIKLLHYDCFIQCILCVDAIIYVYHYA